MDTRAETRIIKQAVASIPKAWFKVDWRILVRQAAGDHLVLWIGATLCLAQPVWWVWIPVWTLMAGRIHALAILMHDLVHVRELERRPGLKLALDAFVCWPVVMNMDYYGLAHGYHHRESNLPGKDPYFVPLHAQHPLIYPSYVVIGSLLLTLALIVRLLIFPLTLVSRSFRDLHAKYFAQLGASPDLASTERHELGRQIWIWGLGPTIFWYAVLTLVTWQGVWFEFGVAYGIPLVLSSVLGQVRLACDHIYTEALGNSMIEQVAGATNIEAPWWQNVILGAHGTAYHALHHIVPTLPNYRLRAAHEILKAAGSETYARTIYTSYFEVLFKLMRAQWAWSRVHGFRLGVLPRP